MSSLDLINELLSSVTAERRGRSKGKSAPHKIAMLLAALDYVRSHEGWNGFIPVNREVELRFQVYYCFLNDDKNRTMPEMANPFIHLRNSTFWKLVPLDETFLVDVAHLRTGFTKVMLKYIRGAEIEPFMWPVFVNLETNLLASKMLAMQYWQEDVKR